MRTRPGISVIEIIVALGIAVVVIAAVGTLIGATHRLTTASSQQLRATSLARQWLEILPSQANTLFGCSCGTTGTCATSDICISTAPDAQQCSVRDDAGFTSCWVDHAIGLGTPSTYKFVQGGNTFTLASADGAPDESVSGFSRTMTINNLDNNPDTKQVTVTVSWNNGSAPKQTQLQTIVTAWKNF